MPPLTLMIKPASGACNMRCSYCYYMDEMANRKTPSFGFMSMETARMVVKRAITYAEGTVTFVFQGGEPTLAGAVFYREWLRLVKQYNTRELQVRYALQTNGLDLTNDMLDVLRDGDFLVGVSVDGTREIHDSRRKTNSGGGTFEQINRSIIRLQQRRIAYNVLCVVDRAVASRANQVFDELQQHGYMQFIPCLQPLGISGESSLSAEEYGRFLVELFDRYEQRVRCGRYVSIGVFDNWILMLRGFPPASCGLAGYCSPNYLVEGNGNVYPCDFYALDEWLLGNICEDSIFRLAKTDRMRDFLESSTDHPCECQACEWRDICRGGCRRDRQAGTAGPPGHNRLCAGFKLFFNERFRQLSSLSKLPILNKPRQ